MRIDPGVMQRVMKVDMKTSSCLTQAAVNGGSWRLRAVSIMIPLVLSFLSLLPEALAMNGQIADGPKWIIDDTKWFTLGIGFRGSGVWVENRSTDNFRTSFSINNARVYLNGQTTSMSNSKATPSALSVITLIRGITPGCPIPFSPR